MKGSVWYVAFLILLVGTLSFFVTLFKTTIIPSSLAVGGVIRDDILANTNQINNNTYIGKATLDIINRGIEDEGKAYDYVDTVVYIGMGIISLVAIVYAIKYGEREETITYGH